MLVLESESVKFCCIYVDLNRRDRVSTIFKIINLALFRVRFYHNAAFDLQNCLDVQIIKNNFNNFVSAIFSDRLKHVIRQKNFFSCVFLYYVISNIMLVFITEVITTQR